MRRSNVTLLALVALAAFAGSLSAEGKGAKGLAQAASKAGGNGAAAKGLNKAGQNLTRVPPGLSRAAAAGHGPKLTTGQPGKSAASGSDTVATDGLVAPSDPANHQKQLLIEQRNRDQRLIQAQKLRELAAKNGDAELAANADRMEAFAQQHYQDRVAHLGRFGVTDPDAAPTGVDTTTPTTTTPTADTPAATTAAAPWWKPNWLFGGRK